MTFGESIKTCFSKFVTWQGRASRSEYWYFILFAVICYVGATLLDGVLGTSFKITNPATGELQSMGYGWVYLITALALILPSLSAMVRRLHDTNRSGWWYWIALVPLIGLIVLIVWFCSRGTVGNNNYGSDPLGGELGETFG